MKKKILLTGGGTAGHIWPVISICHELQKENISYLYVGLRHGLEEKISNDEGVPFKGIFVGKFRSYFSWSNFIDPFKTFFGIVQSLFIILNFRPTVIFSKAGYVAMPVLFWAKFLKIPTVIHESDSVLGKTNEWAFNFARKICLGFPVEYYSSDKIKEHPEKVIYTGIPIKAEFFKSSLPDNQSRRRTILVTGGSQGSANINEIINSILGELLNKYEVYHLTGDLDFTKQNKIQDEHYHVYSFFSNMPELMAKADLIISRAGSTLAEISALSKASILIPLPWASADHQSANAKIYQENRAAEVIPENHLTKDLLLSIITRLMIDESYRKSLGSNAHTFTKSDSAQKITEILISEANNEKS